MRKGSVVVVLVITAIGGLLFYLITPGLFHVETSCSLSQTRTVELPNAAGRIDHMAVSNTLNFLVVAMRDNNSLAIVNTESLRLQRILEGFTLPQAAAFTNNDTSLVVTDGGNGTIFVIDSHVLRTTNSLNLPSDADNVNYDSGKSKLFVGYGDGGVAIIDAASWRLIQTVSVLGHPEAIANDANRSLVFVNVPDGNYVAVINESSNKLVTNFPIENASGIFPMTLDRTHQILFVASRTPNELLAINVTSGEIIAKISIPGDTDDIFYDPATGCIYASSGEGFVTVFREANVHSLQLVARVATYPGARTSLLDSQRGTYFVAVPKQPGHPAEVIVYRIGSH